MAEAHGFIDGDLIEVYLDLPRPQQEEVLGLLQVGGWVDGCGCFQRKDGWMGGWMGGWVGGWVVVCCFSSEEGREGGCL